MALLLASRKRLLAPAAICAFALKQSGKGASAVDRSRAAFTYAEAQARIDDSRLTDELSEGLRSMNVIAKKRRAARADAGALQLASPEVKFEIDTQTQNPMDVGMYQVGGWVGEMRGKRPLWWLLCDVTRQSSRT